jgi:signal transduction histidine kinase
VMPINVLEELKQVPEFKNVPHHQLQWLAEKGFVKTYADGEKVFRKGDPIDEMRIVLQGEVDLYIEQGGSFRYLDTVETKEITGRLPYSRMRSAVAEGIVQGTVSVFMLHKDQFPEMIRNHYELTEALVHTMTDRVRDFTKQQQLNDKMMALGKFSAGLAHELNNPSAAVVRSAQELKKHLRHLPEKFKRVIKIQTTDDVIDWVNDFVQQKITGASAINLSLSTRMEREDELNSWFDEHDMENGYELVETFVEFGIGPHDLDKLRRNLRTEDQEAVINWVNQVLATERLVTEIEEASRRINTLVSSVKSYTHMDQNPEKQRTDVHDGIRNTLTLLSHKIRKGNVKLEEHFQDDLPQACVYVSELNQVWTNLIDNALDALEGRENSVLRITTQRDREFIVVHVNDNGPGIPAEITEKIFDPFFTTKPVGKGTGLGLEVVRQIVLRHQGDVRVTSTPGNTTFSVCLPING